MLDIIIYILIAINMLLLIYWTVSSAIREIKN